jgi:hypothetical protein
MMTGKAAALCKLHRSARYLQVRNRAEGKRGRASDVGIVLAFLGFVDVRHGKLRRHGVLVQLRISCATIAPEAAARGGKSLVVAPFFSRGSKAIARFLATSNKNSGYSRCPTVLFLLIDPAQFTSSHTHPDAATLSWPLANVAMEPY